MDGGSTSLREGWNILHYRKTISLCVKSCKPMWNLALCGFTTVHMDLERFMQSEIYIVVLFHIIYFRNFSNSFFVNNFLTNN